MNNEGQSTRYGQGQGRGGRTFARRAASWFSRIVVIGVAGAILLLVGGFAGFMQEVETLRTVSAERADGIVVLTGGKDRIDTALDLLEAGQGGRLLISGVHPQTSVDAIRRAVAGRPELFDCCVDIDRNALDTSGNASETAKWISGHNFASLIVVTSDYHMPRSLLLLRAAMPTARLVPHAVRTQDHDPAGEHPDSLRLIVAEYLKYAWARLIQRQQPSAGSGD